MAVYARFAMGAGNKGGRFPTANFCEKRIELAKSMHCHYGMAHGFHRVGSRIFLGENWR
jgi:hypothetical protein